MLLKLNINNSLHQKYTGEGIDIYKRIFREALYMLYIRPVRLCTMYYVYVTGGLWDSLRGGAQHRIQDLLQEGEDRRIQVSSGLLLSIIWEV